MKVAIIIPTMNRPDFILRQLRFYELMKSPHPVYISDSSNEENAQKIKDGIKNLKNFEVTYQWAPPGKDCLYQLLPLVKEGYCTQIGDEDFIIPETISECADFLNSHPDYATCKGKQVNIRFRKEDYNQSRGIIERQTRLIGRSIEDKNMFIRAKNFWADQTFLGFTVRGVELEKTIRNITKHFSLMGDMTEFLIMSILIISGKSKALDKLGYVMQISNLRSFDHNEMENFAFLGEKWSICQGGLSEILKKEGLSEEESIIAAKALFVLYLSNIYLPYLFSLKNSGLPISQKKSVFVAKSLYKKLRFLASNFRLLRSIYHKFNPSKYVDGPESKYLRDFKVVKGFIETGSVSR